jgi:peptidase E
VVKERREVAKLLADADVLAVAGGHVIVLLNRLRLFDVAELCADKTIVAWSAGAMVLGGRIVAFHDTPPQGPGYAQVIELGLGVYDDVIPFPHAKRRLRLEDPGRVALLGRRFAPHPCIALDEGCRLDRDTRGEWVSLGGARRLGADGAVRTEGAG